jgi:phage terminase small subunit
MTKKEKLELRKLAYKTWALSKETAKNKKQPFEAAASRTNLTVDQIKKLYVKDKWEERYLKDLEKGTFENKYKEEKQKAYQNITKHTNNIELAETIDELLANSGLNERQKLFICYYLQNFNGTQAALNAGYSKNSANNESSRILNTPNVKLLLNRASQIMSRDVSLSAKQLIEEYIKIAFADIIDFVSFDGRRVKLKDSANIDGRLITEVKQGKDGITVKLVDKKWAMDKLEKLLDFMPDKRLDLDYKKYELAKKIADKDNKEGTGKVIIVNDL